jgi:hypothetical protein
MAFHTRVGALRPRIAVLAAALLSAASLAIAAPSPAATGPRLSVNDAQVVEGSGGYVYLAFTVRLTNPTGRLVTVDYRTSSGTAAVQSDYGPARGELSFRGTKVVKRIYVPIFGDAVPEADETLRVTLSNPSGASFGDRFGVGKILNDDEATLSMSLAGNGPGSVSSSPAGINCGVDCSQTYAYATVVTLTAVPEPGSTFDGWSGGGCAGVDPCDVTMDQAQEVTATFSLDTFELAVLLAGSGIGSVASWPGGINCPGDCSEAYAAGTTITLTATADPGSAFTGWTGGCAGADTTCQVSMTQVRNVTATFDLQSG